MRNDVMGHKRKLLTAEPINIFQGIATNNHLLRAVFVEPSMSAQALASEINELLNDYIKAFAMVDGVAIARCYHAPSITMRGDASVHVFQTRQELEAFFQAVAQKYYDDGGQNARFSGLELQPIGSKSVLVTLEWHQIRPDGSILRSWRQSYNLIYANERWQIFASTFHI
jgi:hypothetical protein